MQLTPDPDTSRSTPYAAFRVENPLPVQIPKLIIYQRRGCEFYMSNRENGFPSHFMHSSRSPVSYWSL